MLTATFHVFVLIILDKIIELIKGNNAGLRSGEHYAVVLKQHLKQQKLCNLNIDVYI